MKVQISRGTDATGKVDRALALLEGLSSGEAAARYGFGSRTVAEWRRKRSRGERMLDVRGRNRAALERVLDGEQRQSIPIGGQASRFTPGGG